MKILSIVLLLSVVLCNCKGWRGYQHGSEVAFHAANFVDYCQTRRIIQDSSMREGNPLIGQNPDEVHLFLFFLGISLVHYAVSYALPEEYRDIWQWFNIGQTIMVITLNHNLGARPLLPWQTWKGN